MTQWRGQERAIASLADALSQDRMHHAWLLGGPKGVGKAGIARAFAKILLGATNRGQAGDLMPDADHQVSKLVDAGTHPDLNIIERLAKDARKDDEDAAGNLARSISVAQIRGLSRFLHLAPSMADRRIIIVDSADDMDRNAANALLKNLEEPPRATIFFLISHAPGRLLPTIRSRCRFLPFQPLEEADMTAILTDLAQDMAMAERAALVAAAEGSPGRALSMCAHDMAAIEAALDRIATTGDPDQNDTMSLARSMTGKAAQQRFEAFVDFVPHFIARRARAGRCAPGAAASAWRNAIDAGGGAVALSLDPLSTVFSLCAVVARLEHDRQAA